jgi:DUF1365 family protein
MPSSCLYLGEVMHRRFTPMRHQFAYRVFSLLVDLDELPAIARSSRLLSHNRFNLLSVHDRDHGPRDGRALKPWVMDHLAEAGIDLSGGRVWLHCFPRVLGYVFNPLSLYWCYDASGALRAVLCEVKNTFGEQYGYLLAAGGANRDAGFVRRHAEKRFHVSPFIAMDGRYDFTIASPEERLSVVIVERDARSPVMIATHRGRRVALDDGAMLRAWLAHPLMTIKVIVAIHWQALRLWRKGARLHPRPAPPVREVST